MKKEAPKNKLSDAERHKRFVDMAREVEASEQPKDFERAFDKVVTPTRKKEKKEEGNASTSRR